MQEITVNLCIFWYILYCIYRLIVTGRRPSRVLQINSTLQDIATAFTSTTTSNNTTTNSTAINTTTATTTPTNNATPLTDNYITSSLATKSSDNASITTITATINTTTTATTTAITNNSPIKAPATPTTICFATPYSSNATILNNN